MISLQGMVEKVSYFDRIHYITENGLRHASGPVHANIPSVTYIATMLPSSNIKKLVN